RSQIPNLALAPGPSAEPMVLLFPLPLPVLLYPLFFLANSGTPYSVLIPPNLYISCMIPLSFFSLKSTRVTPLKSVMSARHLWPLKSGAPWDIRQGTVLHLSH